LERAEANVWIVERFFKFFLKQTYPLFNHLHRDENTSNELINKVGKREQFLVN
jgi:hypothetical protein